MPENHEHCRKRIWLFSLMVACIKHGQSQMAGILLQRMQKIWFWSGQVSTSIFSKDGKFRGGGHPSALQKLLGSLRPWWHPMGGNGKQTQKPCLSLALLLIMPKGQNDQPPNGWFDGLIMFDSQNQPIVRVHWHSFVPHAHHLLWSNHQSLGKLSKEKTLPSNALAGNSWGSRKSVTTFTCRRSKDLMPRVPAWSLV